MPSNVETAFRGLYDRPSGRVRVAPPRKYKIGAKEEEVDDRVKGPTTRRRLGWLLLALVTLALAVGAASCGGERRGNSSASACTRRAGDRPSRLRSLHPLRRAEPAETGAAPQRRPTTATARPTTASINVFSASDLESATIGQNISPGAFVRMTSSTSTRSTPKAASSAAQVDVHRHARTASSSTSACGCTARRSSRASTTCTSARRTPAAWPVLPPSSARRASS